jgi:hypothetical protein
MRYVKLFEDYVQGEYTLIKKPSDLQGNKGIAFTGSDQLGALIEDLEAANFTFMHTGIEREEAIRRADSKKDTILWMSSGAKNFHYNESDRWNIDAGIAKGNIFKFEDFFEENPSFDGRHRGKNYGL